MWPCRGGPEAGRGAQSRETGSSGEPAASPLGLPAHNRRRWVPSGLTPSPGPWPAGGGRGRPREAWGPVPPATDSSRHDQRGACGWCHSPSKGDRSFKSKSPPRPRTEATRCWQPWSEGRTGGCLQNFGAQPVAPDHCLLDSIGVGAWRRGPVHPPHPESPQKPNAIQTGGDLHNQ